jgi:hypothetical protein
MLNHAKHLTTTTTTITGWFVIYLVFGAIVVGSLLPVYPLDVAELQA